MFNALRTEQLIAGIGAAGRAAASASGPPDEYARGQLLSAYSVSRLLAAEVSAEASMLAWLRGELTGALASYPDDPDAAAALPAIEDATDSAAIGDALVTLLAKLRARDDDSELRRQLHSILREMTHRELLALAARPEGAKR
jgi:thioredoxin-like negative regulator of GroEL